MASLVRTQLRLAIGVLLIFTVLLGGLPLLFALEPQLSDVRVGALPLPWLLLGVVVYPVLIAGGYFYVRRAERNEIDFSEIVERS
jgi:predicted membrane channel-forming protein YqfA (hemolysin III family)